MIKFSPALAQFAVYLCGGLLSALIDVGAMQIFLMSGLDLIIATTIGFFSGLGVNYLFHSKITFKKMVGLAPVMRYMTVVALNYVLTIACVYAAVALETNAMVGKLTALPLVAINGFILGKRWIFK